MSASPSKALFASVLAFALLSGEAHGFIFIAAGGYNKGSRPVANAPVWSARSVTFVINTNQSAYGGSISPELTSSEFYSAVEQGVRAWASACQAELTVVLAGSSSATKSAGDQINSISWDNRTTAEGNVFADSSVLAAATSAVSSDVYSDCDIVVNGEFSGTFGISGEASKFDLISTIAHEVGHCLGIDHPVEPPTYTSSNQILNSATMVQAAVAGVGSTFRRTINQDDIDAVTCVYPRGGSLRSGSSCSSYHGTNGGAAITGAISGGPSFEYVTSCGTEQESVTLATNGATGSGCIDDVIAAERGQAARRKPGLAAILGSVVFQLLLFAFAGYAVLRMRRAFLVVLALLTLSGGEAAAKVIVDLAGEYRWINRAHLLDQFAQLDPADGWSSIELQGVYKKNYDGVLRLLFGDAFGAGARLRFGGYGRYVVPEEAVSKGVTGATGVTTTKTTTLSGYLGGPLARLYLMNGEKLGFYLESGAGLGQLLVSQEVSGSSRSGIEGKAFAYEVFANAALRYRLSKVFGVALTGGYALNKSYAAVVSGTSGTLYSSFREGDRLLVTRGGDRNEFKIDRSGFVVGLALTMSIGGSGGGGGGGGGAVGFSM